MVWNRLFRKKRRTAPIRLDDRVARAPGQLHDEIDGQVVLLGAKAGDYFAMNALGSAIWRALERDVAVGTLCETLTAGLDTPEETVRRDVIAFLGQLRDQGLITVAGDAR